ncbi:hypothetical protein RRSWK_05000 [Rhodopirellula sp. SWK7]|nr:hypothetical protein RRSWK_05000 [Rhodopirellula sp. SWK7]
MAGGIAGDAGCRLLDSDKIAGPWTRLVTSRFSPVFWWDWGAGCVFWGG